MKTKKITAVVLATVSVSAAAAFAACGGNGGGDKVTISLAGSTSVEPLMGALADEYMEQHKNVTINVQGGGSGVGITNAKDGKGDFGMASKAVSEDEVTSVKIADDGIVVIVNKSNELTNVTSAELYELYTAGTAIGSATLPIAREPGSGTRDAFEELVKNGEKEALKENSERASNTKEFNTTGGVLTEVQTNKASLGYISLGAYDEKLVKKVSFEGVEATVAGVKDGSYKMSRPFNLLYNTSKGLSDGAKAFLDFILSAEGQSIIAAEGYITAS